MTNTPGKSFNRLIGEKSPYLLQHVRNPVDWYPWGMAAFAKARKEDKPIFLSVGYSTCHWCHVMARESFANEEIAAVMNRHFVNVKVDREERPDVDKVYMAFVQATTGGGGWPMSVWLTPDLKPFIGGTYYPPDDRWGRPGFKNMLLRIAEAWEQDQARIHDASSQVLERLRQATTTISDHAAALDSEVLEKAYQAIKASFDSVHGGFGDAPKFPRPSVPDFLLRYYARSDTKDALDMALFTLRKMADGGMHDHLGGGFHRYSVDERWHVPHFEKMLYDQAQLASTYLDAYQITREDFYADVARDILDYVRRDMTGGQGQFYSAEDADSDVHDRPGEHAEGAFYVWKHDEIEAILDPQEAALFNDRYGIENNGNVREDPHGEFSGQNILIVTRSVKELARKYGLSETEVEHALSISRTRLCEARAARPRPHLDDKTLTAWNGLMISAFARAYQALGNEEYLAAAAAAAVFVHENLYDQDQGTLLRRYRDGHAAIEGYADDYSFLVQGLLDLYEASFDIVHLMWATELQNKQNDLFWDADGGGYFSTSDQDNTILLRIKEGYDGAEPSPNSVALLNLSRLAQMTDSEKYRNQADQILAAFHRTLSTAPHAMPRMMVATDFHIDKPMQIVIAGKPGAPDTQALQRAAHGPFVPNKIVLLADGGSGQETLARYLQFMKDIWMTDGKATAFVCKDYVCKLPIVEPDRLRAVLEKTVTD